MQLTTAQLQILKGDINTNPDPTFAAYRAAGNAGQMAEWYNVDSTFIVYKPTEPTTSIGDVVNYVAVAALTDANVNKLNLFYTLNPSQFEPARSDERQYLADVFSGALGGAGQATRDALDALYRRAALKGEKLYCTGVGTTLTPGDLNATAQGQITTQNILDAQALP
jgi:hypothetical protein